MRKTSDKSEWRDIPQNTGSVLLKTKVIKNKGNLRTHSQEEPKT